MGYTIKWYAIKWVDLYLLPFLRYGQFSVEKAHFLPPSIQPKFQNVPLALDCWNFARLGDNLYHKLDRYVSTVG